MAMVSIIYGSVEYLVDACNFEISNQVDSMPEIHIVGNYLGERKADRHGRAQGNAQLKRVIFNDPATIVYWTDGTKTVVKCQPGDTFDPLMGFLMAVFKKACGNKGNYNNTLKKIVPGYGGKKDDDAT